MNHKTIVKTLWVVAALGTTVPVAASDLPFPKESVTGHAFSKERSVLAGDLVQWDVVNTVGNQGLVMKVTDTLPDELAFVPDSPKAVEFYLVNADGSIGQEITDQWRVSIKGQTMTAYPVDPFSYRYTDDKSEENHPTRFLYRVYSVVRSDVPSGVDLVNRESLFIENPPKIVDGKRLDGEVIELTSDAKVYTPEYKRPTVLKQLSKDGGKTWEEESELSSISDNFMYRIVVAIPPKTAKDSLEICDDMENLIDADAIKIYWGEEPWTASSQLKDVTSEFEVSEKSGSDFSMIAAKSYVKKLRNLDELTYVTVVSTKTDLQISGASSEEVMAEISKYPEAKVPNQALASVDAIDLHSNTVYVSVPENQKVEPKIGKVLPATPSSSKTPKVDKQSAVTNAKLPKAGDVSAGWTIGLGAAIIGLVAYLKRK
jgi:fimbrial isopeptide formation D2 family protein/LPXTG-motif cell wall-anchored protein